MKLFLLFLFMLSVSVFGGPPSETVEAFQKACVANKPEEATRLIGNFPNLHPQIGKLLNDGINRRIDSIRTGESTMRILAERIEGDFAVVLIKEEKRDVESQDYDPIYVFKQDGAWKINPKFSNWKIAAEELNKRETFEKLEKWFKEQKAKLKAQPK